MDWIRNTKTALNNTILLSVASLFLVGCDRHMPAALQDEKQVRFSFVCSGTDSESRVITDSETGAGVFTAGDKVGIYSLTDAANSEYRHFIVEFDGSEWYPGLSFKDLGIKDTDVSHTITAYYPADESLGHGTVLKGHGYVSVTLDTDQTERYRHYGGDLLFGQGEVGRNSGNVSVSMNHKMLRVDIDISAVKSRNLDIRVWGAKEGRVEIETLSPDIAGVATFDWFRPYRISEGLYSVITFPQSLDGQDFTPDMKVELTSNHDNPKTSVYTLKGKELDMIKSPGKVTINLSSGEEHSYVNKKIWFKSAGHSPLHPDNGWFLYDEYSDLWVLKYKYGYGWFDCNKKNSIDNTTQDKNLCWAAVGSNFIHWWFENNAPYSYKYRRWYNDRIKNGDVTGMDTIPDTKFLPLLKEGNKAVGGSSIFDYFTAQFYDGEGYTDEGIDWFFCGVQPRMPAGRHTGKGGFFKEVYPVRTLSESVNLVTKDNFNITVKNAIETDGLVGFSIKGHVQNIWGAEFDANGDVAYIYAADNNFGLTDAQSFGGGSCSRLKITYRNNRVYVGHSGRVQVLRLTTMSLGTEMLKRYVERLGL